MRPAHHKTVLSFFFFFFIFFSTAFISFYIFWNISSYFSLTLIFLVTLASCGLKERTRHAGYLKIKDYHSIHFNALLNSCPFLTSQRWLIKKRNLRSLRLFLRIYALRRRLYCMWIIFLQLQHKIGIYLKL